MAWPLADRWPSRAAPEGVDDPPVCTGTFVHFCTYQSCRDGRADQALHRTPPSFSS